MARLRLESMVSGNQAWSLGLKLPIGQVIGFLRPAVQIQRHGLGPPLNAEFLENVSDVIFDRVLAEFHELRYLLVGMSGGDGGQHALLLGRQLAQPRWLGRLGMLVADNVQDGVGDLPGEYRSPGMSITDGLKRPAGSISFSK